MYIDAGMMAYWYRWLARGFSISWNAAEVHAGLLKYYLSRPIADFTKRSCRTSHRLRHIIYSRNTIDK